MLYFPCLLQVGCYFTDSSCLLFSQYSTGRYSNWRTGVEWILHVLWGWHVIQTFISNGKMTQSLCFLSRKRSVVSFWGDKMLQPSHTSANPCNLYPLIQIPLFSSLQSSMIIIFYRLFTFYHPPIFGHFSGFIHRFLSFLSSMLNCETSNKAETGIWACHMGLKWYDKWYICQQ